MAASPLLQLCAPCQKLYRAESMFPVLIHSEPQYSVLGSLWVSDCQNERYFRRLCQTIGFDAYGE